MGLMLGLAACSGNPDGDDQKNLEYFGLRAIGAVAVPVGGTVPVIVVGYGDVETADVPLEDSRGEPIRGISRDAEGNLVEDAVSVFASFEGNASAAANDVGITAEKFLITGQSAAAYSDGVACAVSRGTRGNCVGAGNFNRPD
jgi:hypothetical protein